MKPETGRPRSWSRRGPVALLVLLLALAPAAADGPAAAVPVVVVTDAGLDDVVALALLLQMPGVDLHGIVATEGALARDDAVRVVERLVDLFNRPDVDVWVGATSPPRQGPPAFRPLATRVVLAALPDEAPARARPLAPRALAPAPGTHVVALGPLTAVAAAVAADSEVAGRIETVLVEGREGQDGSWNLDADPRALAALRAHPLKIVLVGPDPRGLKPEAWRETAPFAGPGTSIAQVLLQRLFADEIARLHYTRQRTTFADELAALALSEPALFASEEVEGGVRLVVKDDDALVAAFERLLEEGRQVPVPVVLAASEVPPPALQRDVEVRREAIVANNGRVEWQLQLRVHEFHAHLGVWTVIGAKMGLRAQELLNAPPHAMRIESHVPLVPPRGCLNDGLLAATGSTPGRGLFTSGEAAAAAAATFSWQGRSVTLTLKAPLAAAIEATISSLREAHGLEDEAYWAGVRRFALDVWERWHRTAIFDAEPE